jgi:[acyl-carrier-protein] S-malonyltransferase
MKYALTFPGQGSQKVGMGADLAKEFAAARNVFTAVDDALGQNLSQIMWEGPEDELMLTENAQPALMAVSMAVMAALEAETDFRLDAQRVKYVAGHSLGEYSALAAAGSISLANTSHLLKTRGKAMQAAVPVGKGAMAAVLGVDLDIARKIAEEAAGSDEVCEIANHNSPGQIVISGSRAAIERSVAIAEENGARRVVILPVSAPFHCSLMQPAAEVMAEALANTEISTPKAPLIANVLASPISDPEEIRKRLVEQITGSVQWSKSISFMAAEGIDTVYEIGAGKVLTSMVRRIERNLTGKAIGTPEEIHQEFPA